MMSEGSLRANTWLIACLSNELRSGSPFGVVLEEQPLVLFRDERGRPVALEDRCLHRNAPLSLGRVAEGRLQCAYHGWTYDHSGAIAEVPALRTREGAERNLRARSYPAVEQDGFVWVSLEGAPRVSPLPFPRFGERGWTSFVMKTRFKAPMQACLENFLDCPHATFLHRYWFRAPTAKPVRARVRTLADGVEAEFFEEPRERSFVWWLLAPRRCGMRHVDRFIAPRTSFVEYEFPNGFRYTITSSCSAIDGCTTDVYTVISYRSPAASSVKTSKCSGRSTRISRASESLGSRTRAPICSSNTLRHGGARSREASSRPQRASNTMWTFGSERALSRTALASLAV